MSSQPLRSPHRAAAALVLALLAPAALPAAGPETAAVGVQPDGRIVVPTNQVLEPAGQQVLFPGRPVDLAFADGGTTVVVKNMRNLVFLDADSCKVKQTLASKVGFSVTG